MQAAVRAMVAEQDRRLSGLEASLAAIQAHMTAAVTAAATPANPSPANPRPQPAQSRAAAAGQAALGTPAHAPASTPTGAAWAGCSSPPDAGTAGAAAPRTASLPEQRPQAGRSPAAPPSNPSRAHQRASPALAGTCGSPGGAAAAVAPEAGQAEPAGAAASAVPSQAVSPAPHACVSEMLPGCGLQLAGQRQRRWDQPPRLTPSDSRRGIKRPREDGGDCGPSPAHSPGSNSDAVCAKRPCATEAQAPAAAPGLRAAPPAAGRQAAGGTAALSQLGTAAGAQQRPASNRQAEAQAPSATVGPCAQRGAPPPWLAATAAAEAAAAGAGTAASGAARQGGYVGAGAAVPLPATGCVGSQGPSNAGGALGRGPQDSACGARADWPLPTSAPALPPAAAHAVAPAAGAAAGPGRPWAAGAGSSGTGFALTASVQGDQGMLPVGSAADGSAVAGPDARASYIAAAPPAAPAAAGGLMGMQGGARLAAAAGKALAQGAQWVGGGAPAAGAPILLPSNNTAGAGVSVSAGGPDGSMQQPGAPAVVPRIYAQPAHIHAQPAHRQQGRLDEARCCSLQGRPHGFAAEMLRSTSCCHASAKVTR